MTFSRLNGSVTPLRLTTISAAVSTVVNRRLQSGALAAPPNGGAVVGGTRVDHSLSE
ncbi:hypothetical protein GXW82_40600 [Streptacidiphilus sp. 4-A2]|nr:hypothetical protein [Streptacidiphilus sp. 4-A2]